MDKDGIEAVSETTFKQEGLQERSDLQRLLREHIEIVSPGALVLAEEYSQWEDSARRIDLLCLDKDANLVVVELKRTEDGGHMDLQALRYAAMVSTMTFDQAVQAHTKYLRDNDRHEDAQESILGFLEWEEPDEENFAQDVHIVLAAADFSKELTSAVMWLNERDLTIRCVRLKPYRLGKELLLDVQQIVPLPEATEYQIRIREKLQRERSTRAHSRDHTRFDVTVNGTVYSSLPKRRTAFHIFKGLTEAGVSPERIKEHAPYRQGRIFRSADGRLNRDEFVKALTDQRHADGKKFAPHRWFCEDEELTQFEGRTYAFSNQWSIKTLEVLDTILAAFPDQDVSYEESIPDDDAEYGD
jgi:hypothetical protein